jgi:hypothetical protein
LPLGIVFQRFNTGLFQLHCKYCLNRGSVYLT